MEDFDLTVEEQRSLREAHRRERDKRGAYRINAVLLLGTGWTQQQVAEALMLDEETLRRFVGRYREGGVDLLLKMDCHGSQPMLNQAEQAELGSHLSATIYLRVADIAAYVKGQYDVAYTVQGMTGLLHRMGFAYKKPKVVPGKFDAQAQRAFVERYEQIKKNKAENDPIYFMDGVHPQHNTQVGYGWIKRGVEKQIKSNTGRKRLNINGAINVQKMEVVTRTDDTLNAQSTIPLLKQIESKHPEAEKIYVICDNARYYYCQDVTKFLAHSKVQLVFLPPYSPNLNLIERLWKYFRKKVLCNHYYEKFAEFKAACEQFFADLRPHADALRSLLTENFHLFGQTP